MMAKSYGLDVDTGEPGARASAPVELLNANTNIFPDAPLIATTNFPRGVEHYAIHRRSSERRTADLGERVEAHLIDSHTVVLCSNQKFS